MTEGGPATVVGPVDGMGSRLTAGKGDRKKCPLWQGTPWPRHRKRRSRAWTATGRGPPRGHNDARDTRSASEPSASEPSASEPIDLGGYPPSGQHAIPGPPVEERPRIRKPRQQV